MWFQVLLGLLSIERHVTNVAANTVVWFAAGMATAFAVAAAIVALH